MKISYILYLAIKNLLNRKMRTILTATGVAISVGFIIFLISFTAGLQRITINQVADIETLKTLDVSIAKSKLLKLDDETIERFEGFSRVDSVRPEIVSATRIIYDKSEVDGIVYGKNVDNILLEDVKLLYGENYNEKSDEAIVNLAYLDQLTNLSAPEEMIGETIQLNIIIGSGLSVTNNQSNFFTVDVKVVGIIDDETAPYIYIPLRIFKEHNINNYSSAKVIVKNDSDVDVVKVQIENLGYKVSSIKETIDQIKEFFNLFQMIIIFLGSIAVIIASLGVFNTMTVALLEKTKEVGFMKALGTTKKTIYSLFIMESSIIGLLGTISGVILGIMVGKAINLYIYNLAQTTNNAAEALFYLPLDILPLVMIIAITISILTGFYPASRAAKIRPLDALRYE
jgi:ABC-type antimicrobial peptide transport system permease subunit